MSAWELPTTVEVAGRSFAIRSDFRAVLDALAALTDPDLTQQEQYVACLQILYPRWKELPDANAALRAAFTFINEGKEDEKQGFRPRLVDWEQDAALIAPAVDKVLGYSCRWAATTLRKPSRLTAISAPLKAMMSPLHGITN